MPSNRPQPGRAGRPRNSRPAQRGGGRARASAQQAGRQRARFTNRAAILLAVFAVLAVSYASSMRAYLQQRSEIDALTTQIATAQSDIAAAEREKKRWRDPAYVEAQARARFGWVLPGEVSYQVLGSDGQPLTDGESTLTDPSSVAPPAPEGWWTRIRSSWDAADHPEKLVTPTPAEKITPSSSKK